MVGVTLMSIVAFLLIPFLQQLFGLTHVSIKDIAVSVAVAFTASCWMELFKKHIVRNKS